LPHQRSPTAPGGMGAATQRPVSTSWETSQIIRDFEVKFPLLDESALCERRLRSGEWQGLTVRRDPLRTRRPEGQRYPSAVVILRQPCAIASPRVAEDDCFRLPSRPKSHLAARADAPTVDGDKRTESTVGLGAAMGRAVNQDQRYTCQEGSLYARQLLGKKETRFRVDDC
jgi:hypothetical protein